MFIFPNVILSPVIFFCWMESPLLSGPPGFQIPTSELSPGEPSHICFASEAFRAELQSGNAEVRAFFGLYLPCICADLGLTCPELPHTEAAVCLGILAVICFPHLLCFVFASVDW